MTDNARPEKNGGGKKGPEQKLETPLPSTFLSKKEEGHRGKEGWEKKKGGDFHKVKVQVPGRGGLGGGKGLKKTAPRVDMKVRSTKKSEKWGTWKDAGRGAHL